MNSNYIPVIVEQAIEFGFPTKPIMKLKAPGNITMLQFVDKIRSRLKLPATQAVHFVLEKGLPVGMSQMLKNVYQNNRNKDGLLHLNCVSENIFGCIPPYKKPIKSKFPGTEALPFGAPEPLPNVFYDDPTDAAWMLLDVVPPAAIEEEEALLHMQTIMENAVISDWIHMLENQYNQYDEHWPEPEVIANLPVPVPQQPSLGDMLVAGDAPINEEFVISDDESDVPDYLQQFMASELLDSSYEASSEEEA